MLTLLQNIGLLGAEGPLAAISTLLLLVLYKGLRTDHYLRSWMFFELLQTLFISGILPIYFIGASNGYGSRLSVLLAILSCTLGGLAPLFLLDGFRLAVNRPFSIRSRLYALAVSVPVLLLLAVAVFAGRPVSPTDIFILHDLIMSAVCLYILLAGFRGKPTRLLAIACALQALVILPRILIVLRLLTPIQQSTDLALLTSAAYSFFYLRILLSLSASSCLLILGMVKVVVYEQQVVAGKLDLTMNELTAKNMELDRLAGLDPLTDLANRRTFEHKLAIEWRRALRAAGTLSIVMIDVDHFKNLNDTYGHAAGDECLQKLAALLRATFRREQDMIARIGGEEFVVLLYGMDATEVHSLCETLRQSTETTIEHCTLSIGCVTGRPGLQMQPEMLVQAADRALYSAKRGGRNRVVSLPFPLRQEIEDD